MTVLLAAALLLGGCAALADDETPDDSVVAAAFYPLEYAAERIADGHVPVESLTSPGVEPHDLDLGVGETATLARASVVVYEEGFQPAVDAAVETNATGTLVDAAEVVDLDTDDLHFWLDPLLMADLGDGIAAALAEADPEHADDFTANAADLRSDLEALDGEYSSGLDTCARDTVVVSHDAFGYLSRYGPDFEPIAGLSPDAEPTTADLARLNDLIRAEGITTVFSETLVSPEMAEILAGDLDIDSGVLDPIEGLGDTTADEDYLSLMRANLAALQKANGCR